MSIIVPAKGCTSYHRLRCNTSCTVLRMALRYCYLRTRLACLTRFSITPSNVSLSSSALSLRFSQYSRISLAFVVSSSNFLMCAWSSLSVMFDNAARVVAHNIFVACKSSSGGDGGPLLFRDALVEEGWSTEADDVLSCFNRTLDPVRRAPGGDWDSLRRRIDGRMSFFCLEAGRISSRSTGTPRETRKRRRMRERTQLGGCKGGGATSCDQSERLLSVRNIGFRLDGPSGGGA